LNQTLGRAIEARKDDLARLTVDEQWARSPDLQVRYGDTGHAKCVQDVRYTLAALAQAIAVGSPRIFAAYIDWIKVLFAGLKIPVRELAESLEITGDVLCGRFPEAVGVVRDYIDLGQRHLATAPDDIASYLDNPHPLSALARAYLDALRDGDRPEAGRLILSAVAGGVNVKDVYQHVFLPVQHEIGRLWQLNQLGVAEEHYCTAATQLVMSQLHSHFANATRNGRRVVATCVGSDLHEIGLRMVADFFELGGWDTYYLGANTPTSSIVQTLTTRGADILAVSATMSFHIKLVADLIERVRDVDSIRQIKILVGGYAFDIDPELWRSIGADGYAPGPEDAVAVAHGLVAAELRE
jgi:methylmalonyl-CoA mutase cobalamin-binding domain/chain